MAIQTESERRQATVLFADISGFTSMSEHLDPEEVTEIMSDCFTLLGSIVTEHGGVIDKFIGDCVMALFGAPKALEGAPRKAIAAALKMIKEIAIFNSKRKLAIPLGIHIGINTGEVLSGMVGSEARRDFTVMGDAVNLASRLKDLAETGHVLVGAFTWRSTRDAFRFNPLKPVSLKGKADLVQVYEVLGNLACADPENSDRMIQSVLVGRDEELKKLELQVMKLLNGQGSVVNLIGEAGIGKSRLCAELYGKDFMKWVTVLEGRSLAVGQTLSYYPLIGILKSWASISEDDSENAAFVKLEAAVRAVMNEQTTIMVPYIATLMGYRLSGDYAASMEGISGESLGKIIAKHLKDLIAKAAEFRPILFVLEDLHWADESTLELLKSIVGLTGKHPVMFLCAWRPGYEETTGKFHGFLAKNFPDATADIALSPLESGKSEELARNLLKNTGIPERLIERIGEKADGNPFFIEEVIRSFIDRGLMVIGKGGLIVSTDIELIDIPNSIDAVIMSRVDRLDEGMKELLKVASVIGRSFFYRILSSVADCGKDFGLCIEGLKDMQLIRERKRIGEVEFLFKHVLVQETVYNSILIRSRKLLHIKVARALEESFRERIQEFYGVLAFHYSQGEELEKAGEYLEKAGTAALESSASSEAILFFQKALSIYLQKKGKGASPEQLAMFEKNIALAFHNKGLMQSALEHFNNALAFFGVTQDSASKKLVKAIIGFIAILRYLYVPLTRSIKEPTQFETEKFKILVARDMVLGTINSTDFFLNGLIDTSILLTRSLLSIPSGLVMLCGISQLFSATGISFSIAGKILDFIEPNLNDDYSIHIFRHSEQWLNIFSGSRVCRFEQETVDFLIKQGDLVNCGWYLVFWGHRFICTGAFREAEILADSELLISEAYDTPKLLLSHYEHLALLDNVRRNADGTMDHVNALIALANKKGDRSALKIYLSFKANAFMIRGNMQEAAKIIAEITMLINEEKLHLPLQIISPLMSFLWFNTISYRDAAEKIERRRIVKKTFPLLKEIGRYGPKYVYKYPEALRLAGTFCLMTGRKRSALRYWKKGFAIGELLGAKPELGRICFEVAKFLADPKNRVRSFNKLTMEYYVKKSRDIFTEIGLEVDLKELNDWETGGMGAKTAPPS